MQHSDSASRATSEPAVPERRQKRDIFFAACLVIYAATGSIYVFDSGLPQPADFVLALGTLVMLTAARIPKQFADIIGLFAALAIYCVFISGVWTLLIADPDMLRPAMYYVYNIAAFVAILMLYTRCPNFFFRTVRLMLLFALGSILVQYLLFYDASRIRQMLGFNNPNQPAYFSLCLLSIALLLLYAGKISRLQFLACYFFFSWIVLISLSMTALAALLLASFLAFLLLWKGSVKEVLVAVTLAAVGLAAASSYVVRNDRFLESFETRMTMDRAQGKIDDVGVRRGYSRIIELPHLAIFGAGESGRHRFDIKHRQEIHSSIGTILFSYGLFGLFVYLYFHVYVLRKGGLFPFLILMVPFTYSLTHQGLRTTMFWIFIAAALAVISALKSGSRGNRVRWKLKRNGAAGQRWSGPATAD
ncbi:hypothetical protein [Parvibaculum sp.]|uniref:hypothetical protein n=1 Tax=Parvibaculum sp. TaxID=2024848 RepID=UPI00391CCD3D